MKLLHWRLRFIAIAAAALVVGCGSSSDSDSGGTPATRSSDVPASAQSSVSGLIAYITELIGMTSETSEPILVGDAVLPTVDNAEPN